MTKPEGPQIDNIDKEVIDTVLASQQDIAIPCDKDSKVHSKVLQLNRWRRSVRALRPGLNRLRFCKRFNPPRVLVEYDHSYDMELEDAHGNKLGYSLADLQRQHEAEAEARQQAEARESEEQASEAEKRAFFKSLSQQTGLSVEEIQGSDEALPAHQQAALEEAERQKAERMRAEKKDPEPLTESERRSVLAATEVPDQNADIL